MKILQRQKALFNSEWWVLFYNMTAFEFPEIEVGEKLLVTK